MKLSNATQAMQAYQHFLYYIDTNHLFSVDNSPWDAHLTGHFHEKLTGLVNKSGAACITLDTVVRWVQEMTPNNQELLMNYIMEFHLNKW